MLLFIRDTECDDVMFVELRTVRNLDFMVFCFVLGVLCYGDITFGFFLNKISSVNLQNL